MSNEIIDLNSSKIKIIGDNIFYCNSIITAYYVIPLNSCNNIPEKDKLDYIQYLTNHLSPLSFLTHNNKISIQKLPKFNQYDFCLLGIESSELNDSITAGFLDKNKLIEDEEFIFSILGTKCIRASKELIFYNYINKLYPYYNINYDKCADFINKTNCSNIFNVISQTVEDKFGYFIMHNEGIATFGLTPQNTYGCILTIKKFPDIIDSLDFSIDYPGMQINMIALPYPKLIRYLRLNKTFKNYSLKIELFPNKKAKNIPLTNLYNKYNNEESIDNVCEFTSSILVTGLNLSDLNQNIKHIISDLKDKNIVAIKNFNQAECFLNKYINSEIKEYEHLTDIGFPLSFLLTNGICIDKSNDKFYESLIREDLNINTTKHPIYNFNVTFLKSMKENKYE